MRRDREIERHLEKIAGQLAAKHSDLKDVPISVRLILPTAERPKWQNVAIPGMRLYLSIPLLQRLEYENEAAALIGLQLAHIQERHLIERLEGLAEKDDPIERIWGRNAMQERKAVETAVELLYNTGYDPRGMVEVWRVYQKHPGKSPYDPENIERLVEETYRRISRFSPLRNPLVTSDTFVRIRKRIRSL